MNKLPLRPAPRPRLSTEEAQRLTAATGDLGFTRPSTAPIPRPKEQQPKSPITPTKPTSLKFEVPSDVWTELRQEALNRRVTVKYLVLEALSEKGYKIDLSVVPEDGRRNR